MKDAIDALDRFRHDGGVGNVALDELNPLAERLDIREVAGAEVVENADAIAAPVKASAMCDPMKPAPPVTRNWRVFISASC